MRPSGLRRKETTMASSGSSPRHGRSNRWRGVFCAQRLVFLGALLWALAAGSGVVDARNPLLGDASLTPPYQGRVQLTQPPGTGACMQTSCAMVLDTMGRPVDLAQFIQ